jgi:hypothetical protein
MDELEKNAELFKKKYEATKSIIARMTKSKKVVIDDTTIAADVTKASTESKAYFVGKKASAPVLRKVPSPATRRSSPALAKSTSASSMPSVTSEVFKEAPRVMPKHTLRRTQSEVLPASRQ